MTTVLHTKRLINSSTINHFKEVTIPVPWGKISGKWWGPTNEKPILCIHGFRDNCGSFDKLIPFLSQDRDISFLAIDLPGHGFSSPFPKGMIYNFMNYIILVQQIYEYFSFSKLSLLGHSLGSMISFISTILYPEKVDFLMCIDALHPLQSTVSKETVRNSIDNYMKYNKFTKEPPSYTWEEILDKMNIAYKHSLGKDSTLCLLERNIAVSKEFHGKYYFNSDPMLKVRTMFNWTQEQMIKDAATIANPIFICEAKQNYARKYRKNFYEIVNIVQKHNKDCEFHTISGTHHLHLNEPEKIGILLKKFLNKHNKSETYNLKDFSIFSSPVPSILSAQVVKHKL
ncbi:serine hydrolase-like protein isoform X1 [Coccinella septempunctata]|uniref:serine hydrolase-like protein isoform X1 n=1 Tax=Coccinella septempunctata TaxID=41139 RepID=UPI001D0652A3|nr:serine hydrolase-like protein isoform X1 [Coccinella septempunctata]